MSTLETGSWKMRDKLSWTGVNIRSAMASLIFLQCSCASSFGAYMSEYDALVDKFEESIGEIDAGGRPLDESEVKAKVETLGVQLGSDLNEMQVPPSAAVFHRALVNRLVRGMFSGELAFHCGATKCTCVGDGDCNNMFDSGRCETEISSAECRDILGVPVCRCDIFLCC